MTNETRYAIDPTLPRTRASFTSWVACDGCGALSWPASGP